jgi:hypothetical protein
MLIDPKLGEKGGSSSVLIAGEVDHTVRTYMPAGMVRAMRCDALWMMGRQEAVRVSKLID